MSENKKITEASKGYLIIICAVFCWSFSEVIVKLLQDAVGPLTLSFFRFFIGGLFLLLVLLLKRDLSGIYGIFRNNVPLFLIASCFAFGISNIIYFIGVNYTQANFAATIYTTYPIWITIYSYFILKERSNMKLKFIGILIGIFGVMLLMTNLNFLELLSSEYFLGNLLVLIGSIIWSLYSVLGKKIQMKEQNTTNIAIKFTMLSSFFASLPIFIILIFTPEFNTFFVYNMESWFWIIFLGIVSTGLGIYLLYEGIKRIELSKGISLAFLKPIFALILAFFILNELPTLICIISIVLIIGSILLINRSPEIAKQI
ncbi:MAG: DMT family transporter [Promethearchaeota archaeon]